MEPEIKDLRLLCIIILRILQDINSWILEILCERAILNLSKVYK